MAWWDRDPREQTQAPDVELWMAQTTTEHEFDRRTKPWEKEDSSKLKELCEALDISVPDSIVSGKSSGFVKGYGLRPESITSLHTLGGADRPRFVYRVVHADSPFEGLKARGHGKVKTDALHFQVLLQEHLNWKCRWASPFLSVATTLDKALVICGTYYGKCREGIKIHIIDTHAEGWNHHELRLFPGQRPG